MLWKGSRYTQPDIQITLPTVLTDRGGQKVNGRLPERLLAWIEEWEMENALSHITPGLDTRDRRAGHGIGDLFTF